MEFTHLIIGFITLVILEIILGIDNLILINVLAARLPKHQQQLARRLGLMVALVTRLLLLGMLAWLAKLTAPLFTVADITLTWRDLILLGGGLFLLYKSTQEIHHAFSQATGAVAAHTGKAKLWPTLIQIGVLDVVFSLDSVITAIGMVDEVWLMATAVIVAVIVMLVAVDRIGDFIYKHPTVKMLAFALLFLVGVALVADGLHFHIPRGYIYFAVGFALVVEMLNIASDQRRAKAAAGRKKTKK